VFLGGEKPGGILRGMLFMNGRVGRLFWDSFDRHNYAATLVTLVHLEMEKDHPSPSCTIPQSSHDLPELTALSALHLHLVGCSFPHLWVFIRHECTWQTKMDKSGLRKKNLTTRNLSCVDVEIDPSDFLPTPPLSEKYLLRRQSFNLSHFFGPTEPSQTEESVRTLPVNFFSPGSGFGLARMRVRLRVRPRLPSPAMATSSYVL